MQGTETRRRTKIEGTSPEKEGEDEVGKHYKKGHLFLVRIIPYPTMAANVVSAGTEFDLFATRPVQSTTTEMVVSAYKAIASLDQSDLELLIPADYARISI